MITNPRSARKLRVGCFAIRGPACVVADATLPIIVELRASDGDVTRIHTWPLAPALRTRPVTTDVCLAAESIFVSSPAAGGVVKIDRASGHVELLATEEDPGVLLWEDETLWVRAHIDWLAHARSEAATLGVLEGRSVVWEGPTEEEVRLLRRWVAYSPSPDSPSPEPSRSLDEWRGQEGDTEDRDPPTPIWRIHAASVERVPFTGEDPRFVVVENTLVGVCRLPSDPIVKHVTPYGAVAWKYPGSVVQLHPDGQLEVFGSVPGTSGSVWVEDDEVWLVGFVRSLGGSDSAVLHVGLSEHRVQPVQSSTLRGAFAVVSDWILSGVGRPLGAPVGGETAEGQAIWANPISGGPSKAIEVPPLGFHTAQYWVRPVRVADGRAWLRGAEGHALVAVDPAAGSVETIPIDIDVSEWVPTPVPPEGVDLSTYEREQADSLRQSFFGGWIGGQGTVSPFIEGIEFDSVELQGVFPASEVVALFRSDEHPAVRFGRRWRLYDELGNGRADALEHADIHLMEDIQAGTGCLPEVEDCHPDESGTVWI